MTVVRTAPTYLLSHPSGYIFRYCIPKDLKGVVGKGELRYSLKTGSLSMAKYRARCMAGYVQMIIHNIRRGGRMSELTHEQINRILRKHYEETIEEDEVSRAKGQNRDGGYSDGYERCHGELISGDISRVAPFAETLLEENGIKLDRQSDNYKRFCRDLVKVQMRMLAECAQRAEGDYSGNFDKKWNMVPVLPWENKGGNRPSHNLENADSQHSLSIVIQEHIDEAKRAGTWQPKTEDENRKILELFLEMAGDVSIDSVDRTRMHSIKQDLMKLPPNMNKSPRYRDKSLDEVLKMDIEKPMSVASVNKYLIRISSLFKYAAKAGYITSNPAEGMTLRKTKRADEDRDPFSDEDLDKLFNSDEYQNDTHRKSYAFWTPLLALFTGARLEEICQLHLDDIQQVDGVWGIDINDKGEKKNKPSPATKRFIPLHPIITDNLSFIDHTESLKTRGELRLFPELIQRRDGYGQTVSKWFARYRKRVGVADGHKAFHSFRHTFITHLKHKQVDPYMLHEIDGHVVDSMTMGRYGKRFKPKDLFDRAILKLNYGIDLSHLENSKYIIKT